MEYTCDQHMTLLLSKVHNCLVGNYNFKIILQNFPTHNCIFHRMPMLFTFNGEVANLIMHVIVLLSQLALCFHEWFIPVNSVIIVKGSLFFTEEFQRRQGTHVCMYNVAQVCILLQGASTAVIKDIMVSAA